jgi:hypothetical protein
MDKEMSAPNASRKKSERGARVRPKLAEEDPLVARAVEIDSG